NRMVINLIDRIDKNNSDDHSVSKSSLVSEKSILKLTDMYAGYQNKWVQNCAKYARSMLNTELKI
ncbi:MAG: hypothetical protein PVI26_04490, partial [Chitinispirillia bacterium]